MVLMTPSFLCYLRPSTLCLKRRLEEELLPTLSVISYIISWSCVLTRMKSIVPRVKLYKLDDNTYEHDVL